MRLLGIDFGKKRIGLAFSEGFLATPLSVITIQTKKQALVDIKTLCEKLNIEKIVVGLVEGTLEKDVIQFSETLSVQTGIPFVLVDETLTSKTAIQKMVEGETTKKKRKTMEDAAAAALILESYLEAEKT